ncbi:hypothetical protein E3N88_08532 [Mikania micrantha]|uniref:BRCT domain-containing protein n=1 Tax=Mikania micrantha TaxID=192012 RepID=A0A5N6PIR0_9ASTR|nr:hypothetical protein E3N88_08532 [Mikania micrantha]
MGEDDDNDDDKSYESDSSTWDFGGEETQIFDSQFCESPISSFGNRCDGDTEQLHIPQSTIPFDDTAMYGNEFAATQVMDLDGENQVMDPDGETQLVNLAGETQLVNSDAEIEVMDIFDSAERNMTQLFNGYDDEEVVVSDHEGSDKTEIANDSDIDSESGNRCGFGRSTAITGHKTFTTIRAACIRAAGLRALSKSPSCPALNSEPDIEHKRVLFQKDQSYDLEGVKRLTNDQESGNKCGFGRSTARKLFDENTPAENETKELNDKSDLDGATNSPILDTELAGLSYINSQEPGDASQANALDFVDSFLKVNTECGNDFDIRRSAGDQSKPVLSAKGTQIFAKSVNVINEVDKRQTFCWDNNLEDEGGGEFYRKKRDVLFASGSQKLKSSVPSRSGKNLGQSDSKLVLGKNNNLKKSLGTVIKDLTFRKNLIKELDKQSTDMANGMDIQGTVQETTEVQFDTQMAAEAMEDLCYGLLEANHDSTKTNVGSSHMQKGSHKTQPLPVSNEGVRTTRSKSKISSDLSKEVRRAKLGARKSENLDIPNNDINILTGFQSKGKRTSRTSSSTRKEIGAQSISRLTRSKAIGFTEQEKGSIRENFGHTLSGCVTPVSHGTPVKDMSPICMGDEYLKQSCGRPFLIQEVNGLCPTDPLIGSPSKGTRQRRDVSLIRVLFSRHLDGDIIKQQKKILSRLGASESSSMSDATHFIADNFARTRNMLEAIALGKPIVTHLWLESCGQACCHIDEKNFILRDAKKEREFGFTIPSSLARASKNPLLKGHRVLITPNTKPGKEILSSLVKAVHGVAVEQVGGNDNVPEGLLILSCEEDYAVCLPFLEKGLAIYSSELLLNGIVIQRLEYERTDGEIHGMRWSPVKRSDDEQMRFLMGSMWALGKWDELVIVVSIELHGYRLVAEIGGDSGGAYEITGWRKAGVVAPQVTNTG